MSRARARRQVFAKLGVIREPTAEGLLSARTETENFTGSGAELGMATSPKGHVRPHSMIVANKGLVFQLLQ